MPTPAIVLPDVRTGHRSGEVSQPVQSRTLQNSEQSKVVQFTFQAGRGLAEHRAPCPIAIYLARGEATIQIGAESHDAAEGFWAYLPAGLEHAIAAKTNATLLLTLFKEAPKP